MVMLFPTLPKSSSDEEGKHEDLDENYNSDDLVPESSDDEDVDLDGEERIFHKRFKTPWSGDYAIPPTNLTGPPPGPVNIHNTINGPRTPLDFLNLFIGGDVYVRLCLLTNLQANRVLEKKSNTYYANIFQDNPVDTDEMRAFIALRIMMEHGCYKPRYEAYWYGRNNKFVTYSPRFREVTDRHI